MKALHILLISLMGLFAVSCNPKDVPVNDMKNICTELEEKGDSYTEQDWENLETQMEQIEKEMDRYDYTDEELKEIGKIKGRILGYQTKNAVKIFKENAKDAAKMIEGGLEGFLDALSEDSEETPESSAEADTADVEKQLGEAFNRIMEEAGDSIEELAKEIEKAFNENQQQ